MCVLSFDREGLESVLKRLDGSCGIDILFLIVRRVTRSIQHTL